jgi:outer membrane protein assembly factor BamB
MTLMSRLAPLLPLALSMLLSLAPRPAGAQEGEQWVVYEGGGDGQGGPGKGKHIVLVGGDEEYRSEEALPQLGKILAKHHGFKCTVLFAIDPKTGEINPEVVDNIPGLEALQTADLMVIATRFRNLPDEQMKHIVDYLDAGKPVVGLRTATHAFNIPDQKATYAKYGWKYAGKDYERGFGKQVLGETWVAHHGKHGSQSTRGIIAPEAKDHPITRGLKDGDVWGPSDVYTVTLPLPGDSKPIVLGQVLDGMEPDDKPLEGEKNDPMMPVAWTKTYEGAHGQRGRVFTTTMGAATDLVADGTRRMVVNGIYWALGMEDGIPKDGTDVTLVGEYKPTNFGFKGYRKGVRPAQHKMQSGTGDERKASPSSSTQTGSPRRVVAADYSKKRLAIIAPDGTVEWETKVRDIHDLHVLPSGNLLFQTSWTILVEVNPTTGELVWQYDAARSNGNEGRKVEVHAFQRLADGVTMIAESGPGRIIEVDRDGKLLKEVKLKIATPDPHRDTRLARKLESGNYLVAHEGEQAVREYDPSGKVVWEHNVGSQLYSAERLRNGNTLIGTGNGHRVVEVDKSGKEVWSLNETDIPGVKLAWVTVVERLPSGNTLVVNCHAGPENPQVVEVTPEKKLVWSFKDFETFGNALPVARVMPD